MKYILGKIEYFKGSTHLVHYDDDNVSIEHIYPQNPTDEWDLDETKMQRFVFRLGNICLLEKNLNRVIQNVSFEKKLPIYQKSSYYYAKKISSDYTEWNDSSIIKLQTEMANSAVSIWKVSI